MLWAREGGGGSRLSTLPEVSIQLDAPTQFDDLVQFGFHSTCGALSAPRRGHTKWIIELEKINDLNPYIYIYIYRERDRDKNKYNFRYICIYRYLLNSHDLGVSNTIQRSFPKTFRKAPHVTMAPAASRRRNWRRRRRPWGAGNRLSTLPHG